MTTVSLWTFQGLVEVLLIYVIVIVGGGTAGLVIAARLTENPDVTVGVLEAGKSHLDDILTDCPAFFPKMLNNPDYDWQFMTEPQKHGLTKTHHIPRGRVLGGSSALNFMMVCLIPLILSEATVGTGAIF